MGNALVYVLKLSAHYRRNVREKFRCYFSGRDDVELISFDTCVVPDNYMFIVTDNYQICDDLRRFCWNVRGAIGVLDKPLTLEVVKDTYEGIDKFSEGDTVMLSGVGGLPDGVRSVVNGKNDDGTIDVSVDDGRIGMDVKLEVSRDSVRLVE